MQIPAKEQAKRELYINNVSNRIKVTVKDLPQIELYLYTGKNNLPGALMFVGRRGKPSLYSRFRNEAEREAHLKKELDGWRQTAAQQAERDAQKKAFRHSFKVGDILHSSWGYEQTQCDYYQVTATTPGTITVRPIDKVRDENAWGGDMCGNYLPVPDSFSDRDAETTHRVVWSPCNPDGVINLKYSTARKWDGKSKYCSWYA